MAAGAFLPLVVFVLIAGGVGFRLSRLWWRTRGAPEGCLGPGLLIVTASMPLSALGRVPAIAMEPAGRLCFAGGLLVAAAGLGLMVGFNRVVFRPRARWATALHALVVALLFGSVIFMGVANARGESVQSIKSVMRPGTVTLMSTILGCFAWGAVESFACLRAARRRLALGLSDPLAIERFRLWGIASVACALLLGVLTACVLAGMVILQEPLPLLTIAACGIVMSACWSLTFLTPAWYRRRVLAGRSTDGG